MDRKEIEEIRNFLEWGGGTLVWDHQVGVVGLATGVDTRGCFLRLPSIRLRGCCGFGLRLEAWLSSWWRSLYAARKLP